LGEPLGFEKVVDLCGLRLAEIELARDFQPVLVLDRLDDRANVVVRVV